VLLTNRRRFAAAAIAAVAFSVFMPCSLTAAISYVQGNYSCPQSPQTSMAVTYTKAQVAGDLNVVVIGWNDATATIASVTDTAGNQYLRAGNPTIRTGNPAISQSIYYAKNIASAAASANAVTVAFSVAAAFPDIRILEYAGLDLANPLDVFVGSTGNSSTTSSAAVTTTNANDLLVAGNTIETFTTGAGTGFTSRLITNPDSDIAEDRTTTTTGSYSATASLGGTGAWALAKLVKQAVRRPRPADLLPGIRGRGQDAAGLGYLSGHAAVAVALVQRITTVQAKRATALERMPLTAAVLWRRDEYTMGHHGHKWTRSSSTS